MRFLASSDGLAIRPLRPRHRVMREHPMVPDIGPVRMGQEFGNSAEQPDRGNPRALAAENRSRKCSDRM